MLNKGYIHGLEVYLPSQQVQLQNLKCGEKEHYRDLNFSKVSMSHAYKKKMKLDSRL
jgi:hypothetical protein